MEDISSGGKLANREAERMSLSCASEGDQASHQSRRNCQMTGGGKDFEAGEENGRTHKEISKLMLGERESSCVSVADEARV